MRWKVATEKAAPIIPMGEYVAMEMDIRDTCGCHGATARANFILAAADELDGRQKYGLANKKPSDNSELDRSIAEVLHRKSSVTEEVFSQELPHTVRRAVVNRKKNGEGQILAKAMQVLAVDMLSEQRQ